jgi:mycofactocin precursor
VTTTHHPAVRDAADTGTDRRAVATPAEERTSEGDDRTLVEEELMVEDVSIDGMCGVY